MADDPKPATEQGTLELVRSIATDTGTLIRKEMELARHELVEAVGARLAAAGAMAVAGILGLFTLGFLGLALAHGLDRVVDTWLSRLIVAAVFAIIAMVAVGVAKGRAAAKPLVPRETARTLKEDVEWAKSQLTP